MEANPNVVSWSSEEVVVPYICATDSRKHRYFMDVYFMTKTGDEFLIEIKPKKETLPPVTPKRKSKRYLQEAMTYIKNQSKWEAATAYAKARGMRFEIWHEDRLKQLGIKLMGTLPAYPKKKVLHNKTRRKT